MTERMRERTKENVKTFVMVLMVKYQLQVKLTSFRLQRCVKKKKRRPLKLNLRELVEV